MSVVSLVNRKVSGSTKRDQYFFAQLWICLPTKPTPTEGIGQSDFNKW